MESIDDKQLEGMAGSVSVVEIPYRTPFGVSVLTSDMAPGEGWTPMTDDEFELWRLREPDAWTDGFSVRYAFECDLPGWRRVDDSAELESLLLTQATALANAQITNLRREATEVIAALQDAVDNEVATGKEAALLQAWKIYRIALVRVSEQPRYPTVIDWPELPV